MTRTVARRLAILALAAILATPAAQAGGLSPFGPTQKAPESAGVWDLLREVWGWVVGGEEKHGLGIDPNGQPTIEPETTEICIAFDDVDCAASKTEADHGCGIDPNGPPCSR